MASNRDAEEGAQLSEQRLDLERVLWLLRRQWRFVVACVLVGALIPTAMMLLRPTSYTSTSLVLVPTSVSGGSSASAGSNGNSANNNTTDSVIAKSAAVLGAAGSKVSPPVTLQAAQSRVSAEPIAANLVQITASGSSPREAEALANAVATRLVEFVTSPDVSNGSSALAGLEAQAAELTKQVNEYDQEIKLEQAAIESYPPTSPVAQSDTQLLGSLTTAQSNASLQLQSVDSQIAAAKLNNAAVNGGTEVIQHASSATRASLFSEALPIVVGAVLGFLVGGAYVLIRQRRSHLSTRDAIASAAGLPVVLSAVVPHVSKCSDWLNLLREHDPQLTERWNVCKVLRSLDDLESGRRVVTVITLADDSASMAAVARFAVTSAAMDIPTSLVLMSDDSGLRGLIDACDLLTARGEDPRPDLRLFKGSPPVDEPENAVSVISIVLSPDQPKLPAFAVRGTVFIALSAGFVGPEQLARVLIVIGQEGLSVEGLFIVNPMRADRTLGLLSAPHNQVTRFQEHRALEAWVGGADVR